MKQENEIFAVLIFIICSRAELKRCSEVRQEMFPHNLQLLPKSFLLSLSRFLFNNTKNLPMISIEIVFQSTMNSSRERVKECPRSCLDDKFLHKNDTKRRNRNVPHRKIYGLFLLDLFVVSQRAGKCDPVEGFTDNNDMVACSCCTVRACTHMASDESKGGSLDGVTNEIFAVVSRDFLSISVKGRAGG